MTEFLGGVALIAIMTVVRGWAISTMWNWFIVPLGVTHVGYIEAVGLSLLISLFTTPAIKENKRSTAESAAYVIAFNATGVGLGWLVRLFA